MGFLLIIGGLVVAAVVGAIMGLIVKAIFSLSWAAVGVGAVVVPLAIAAWFYKNKDKSFM